MGLRLADGVTYCVVGGETIFLDLSADRYLACRRHQHDAMHLIAEHEGAATDAIGSLDQLLHRGLIVNDPSRPTDVHPEKPQLATRSAVNDDGVPTNPFLLIEALVHLHWAKRQLQSNSLRSVVSAIAKAKQSGDDRRRWRSDESAASLASSFRRTRFIVDAKDRCLLRSIALARMLLRHRLRPTVVFGVRARPFVAHCWVQSGDTVLTDPIDEVQQYTAIRVL